MADKEERKFLREVKGRKYYKIKGKAPKTSTGLSLTGQAGKAARALQKRNKKIKEET